MLKLLSKSNDNDIFHSLDVQGFISGFYETGSGAVYMLTILIGST